MNGTLHASVLNFSSPEHRSFFSSHFCLNDDFASSAGNPLRASRMRSFVYSSCRLLRFVALSPRAQQVQETFPRQHLDPLLERPRAKIGAPGDLGLWSELSTLPSPFSGRGGRSKREPQCFVLCYIPPTAFSLQRGWESSVLPCAS